MTTMKEIAHRAGVSVSTVSLVLNNHDEGRVNADTAANVRAIAKAMGYRPNPLARSLRTSRTRIIGFVSEEIATTPYAGGIVLGAQDAASELGYMMITVNTDGRANEKRQLAALKRYGVDGFLYAKMSNRVTSAPEGIAGYPTVIVDAVDGSGGIPSIAPDETRIGYDATRHLIDAGCRRIAYVGCAEPMLAEGLRLEGYRSALRDAGIEPDDDLAIRVWFNQPALDAVSRLFDERHPDGFFCFNDARAWYVYECAARRGLVVGRDVSVVGVDNHRVIAETFAPQLTTVELPHYEMGYWSVCRLVSLIEDRPLDDVTPPRTTAPLPPFDADGPVSIHCTLIEKDSVAHHAAA